MASSAKCCFWTWLLILAFSMWVAGLTVGIIGAVGFAPLNGFRSHAKSTTCTLQSSYMAVKRCNKWGNCLSVTWRATHPDINNAGAIVTASIIDKFNLGYYDALTWQAKRKSGDIVPCLVDTRNQLTGYFAMPGNNYKAELIAGWILFFIGTFIWIIFFMWVCCDVKCWRFYKICDLQDCCDGCSCCDSKPSYSSSNYNSSLYGNSTPANPLYSPTYTSTSTIPGTGGNFTTGKAYEDSGSSASENHEEMTPIPPHTAQDPYIEPEGGAIEDGAGAGAGAGYGGGGYDSSSGAGAGGDRY